MPYWMIVVWKSLPSPEDSSPYNEGWRYWLSVGAATLLWGLFVCIGLVVIWIWA